uniref:Ig-like domain-containing protein n=1 Tax=Sinocyclocheilus rhinocerous TaxID=307959 RepID=A0A673H2H4_9TELE
VLIRSCNIFIVLLLCVALPITFKQELKNQEGEEGNNITLRCELSKASADVKWSKGEEVLKHGEKFQLRQIATKMELVIRKAIPEDSGVYFCVCPDQTSIATVGEKYQMRTEGRIAELLIKNVNSEDVGFYSCTTGKEKTTAEVKVRVKCSLPSNINSKDSCEFTTEGETAFLCCELSKPGVEVQWKKGAIRLRPGDKYEMKQDGCKVQLQIHDLTRQDSGTYKCCSGSLVTTASIVVKGENREIRGPYTDVVKNICPLLIYCTILKYIFKNKNKMK